MPHAIQPVQVWACDVMNRPERLARILEALAAVGAAPQFLVARRVNENTSRVFIAPIEGEAQRQAAGDVGLVPASGLHTICVEGPDEPGLSAEITRCVAAAGINIRGASAATVGRSNAFYLAFSTADEMERAIQAITARLGAGKSSPRPKEQRATARTSKPAGKSQKTKSAKSPRRPKRAAARKPSTAGRSPKKKSAAKKRPARR